MTVSGEKQMAANRGRRGSGSNAARGTHLGLPDVGSDVRKLGPERTGTTAELRHVRLPDGLRRLLPARGARSREALVGLRPARSLWELRGR
jgi:hypothetical protein